MQEWDAFILRKHLSSEQHLPRYFIRFVREKASWLVAKRSRAEEFSKHVSTLLARRVLPDSAIAEATQLLNDARSRQTEEEPAQPPKKRTSGGCCTVCGEPVPPPAMLICANKVCLIRLAPSRQQGAYSCEVCGAAADSCTSNARTVSTTTRVWRTRRRRAQRGGTGSARRALRWRPRHRERGMRGGDGAGDEGCKTSGGERSRGNRVRRGSSTLCGRRLPETLVMGPLPREIAGQLGAGTYTLRSLLYILNLVYVVGLVRGEYKRGETS